MTSVIFTLCSNNYLSHAKTLGDSLIKSNPDIHFVIGLVDERHPNIDYNFFPFEILSYDQIGCSFFVEMISKYNVIEFNTAVKPFYFEYFFQKYGANCLVYYIDPDIAFYSSLKELNETLAGNNIILTPHIITPQIKVSAFETMILNVGVYNLGFIGIRNTEHSFTFIKWWQERLKELCYIDHAKGLFVDQIWINLVPILFPGVHISMSPGCNMACWNFHERNLVRREGIFYVNDLSVPLVFFHFSGYKPKDPIYFSKNKIKEYSFEARPDLKEIFKEYAEQLMANGYEKYSKLKPLLKFESGKYSRKQRIGLSLKFRTNAAIKKHFGI